MAGLLQQEMPQGEETLEPQAEPQPEQDETQEPQQRQPASQQDQDNKDNVVAACMNAFFDEKLNKHFRQILKAGAKNPEQTLAQVVVMLISGMDKKSGGKIPRNIILPAAEDVITLIAKFAQKYGYFQTDDDIRGRALASAIAQFAKKYGVKQQEVQGMMQQLGAQKDQPPSFAREAPQRSSPAPQQTPQPQAMQDMA